MSRPVLILRHNRSKLIIPLLAAQILGAVAFYCVYAYQKGWLAPGQLPILIFGVLTGGLLYLYATAYFVSRLISPHFFTLHEDGTAIWRPMFSTQRLGYRRDVGWRIEERKIHLEPSGDQPALIDIPKTVSLADPALPQLR